MLRLANPEDKHSSPPRTEIADGQRRKAVATALGERFVQIFLCNEVPQPIILEDIMGLFSPCVDGSSSTMTNQMCTSLPLLVPCLSINLFFTSMCSTTL